MERDGCYGSGVTLNLVRSYKMNDGKRKGKMRTGCESKLRGRLEREYSK